MHGQLASNIVPKYVQHSLQFPELDRFLAILADLVGDPPHKLTADTAPNGALLVRTPLSKGYRDRHT